VTALADAVPALLVVLAIPLAAWGWSRRNRPQPHRRLRITDKAGLAKGSWVAVVEVDGRRLLIGAAEHGVTLIAELGTAPVTELDTIADDGHRNRGRPDRVQPSHRSFAPRTNGINERPRIGLLRRMQLMTLRSPVPPPTLEPFDAPPQ